MREHKLKTWTNVFDAVADGRKRFEWRRDDRGYEVGDVLVLKRYLPPGDSDYHSGRFADYTDETERSTLRMRVTYILRGGFDVPPGYCVMSIEPAEPKGPGA